ncbi:hypothetical protein FACS1894132_11530 [Clostridia bacterium]|nr:hypothetical protein FACS1894132_11530 [Clostridia bacterium]
MAEIEAIITNSACSPGWYSADSLFANALDGNYSTLAHSANATAPYFTLTLDKPYKITKFSVAPQSGYLSRTYCTIDASADGTAWTRLYTNSANIPNNTMTDWVVTDSGRYKFIKITLTGSAGYLVFSEFRTFGETDTTKYLCADADGVKAFVDAVWTVIGELPVTEDMFGEYGADMFPQDLSGLLDDAEVYFFTDDPLVLETPENHALTVRETVTSKPKTIIQTVDFDIADVDITKLEFEFVTAKRDSSGNAVGTNGRVRAAFSFDLGVNWYTFNNQTLEFETLDITDTAAFLENGLNPSSMSAFDYSAFNALRTATLRFAYILEKPTLTDAAKVRKTKITYASGVAI